MHNKHKYINKSSLAEHPSFSHNIPQNILPDLSNPGYAFQVSFPKALTLYLEQVMSQIIIWISQQYFF
jgi:hypothetical protein